jgi:mRNA interferase MazF
MKRGKIWIASGGPDYAGKPRPVVIVQGDAFDATESIPVCALTTHPLQAPLFRLPIEPSATNGLHAASWLMVDKIDTFPKLKVGIRIGLLVAEDILRLNRAIAVFLGLSS